MIQELHFIHSALFGRASLLVESSDDYIRLGILDKKGALTDKQHIRLPSGVICDGKILDQATIAAHIKQYLRPAKIKNAAILLQSPCTIVRFALFPEMREKELSKAVADSYCDYFPRFQEEMAMGWKRTSAGAGKLEVMMAALPVATAMSYVSVFEGLRMGIHYIDCFESCLLNVFAGYRSIAIAYQKHTRLAFLYLPSDAAGAMTAIWDVSTEESPGYTEMIRSYAHFVVHTACPASITVYALCTCPEWVRAFFEAEGAVFLHPANHTFREDQCCLESSSILQRRSR